MTSTIDPAGLYHNRREPGTGAPVRFAGRLKRKAMRGRSVVRPETRRGARDIVTLRYKLSGFSTAPGFHPERYFSLATCMTSLPSTVRILARSAS